MKAQIQVGIRLRPFLDNELTKGYMNSKVKADPASHKISVQSNASGGTANASSNGGSNNRVFEFDHIFEQSQSQDDVYRESKISELVSRVLDGFHSTIFAYGQTGSGKTYTMEGKHDSNNTYASDEQKGIVARTLDDLFAQIAHLKATTNKIYNVTCSFLQIYNEKIYDLLCNYPANVSNAQSTAAAQGLKLRWNPREQFQVENLFVFDVKTPKDATSYFLQGIKNRVTASHKLNMQSSRSHTIFTITVHSFTAEGAHETTSKMQLVDLAGSERIALTGTEGKTAKESIDINKSLFTLRQVITALSEMNQPHANSNNNNAFNQTNAFTSTPKRTNNHQNAYNQSPDSRPNSSSKHHQIFSTTLTSNSEHNHYNKSQHHIPYRESKLTSLLKQSIGGNSYCLMLACIVPNDAFVDEVLSTLHYATRATYIKNQPVQNVDPNKQKISEMTQENSSIRGELDKANAHIAFLTQALQKSESIINDFKAKCRCAFSGDNTTTVAPTTTTATINVQDQIAAASSTISNLKSPSKLLNISQANPQLSREQMLLIQQQELFISQRNQQEQHQRMLEDKMSQMNKQFQETDIMRFTASTSFNQAPNTFESSRLTGFRNTRYMKPVEQQENQFIQQQQQQQQQQTAPNPQIASHVLPGGEYENFSQRLIESITLVRSLLESNKELRQQTDEFKNRMREQEIELEQLIAENQSLQERLDAFVNPTQLLETHSQNNTNSITVDEDESVTQSIPNTPAISQIKSANNITNINATTSIDLRGQSKNELIQEILELRHNQKLLEQRVKCIDIADRSPTAGSNFSNNTTITSRTSAMNTTAGRFSNPFQSRTMNNSSHVRVASLHNPPTMKSVNMSLQLANDNLAAQSSVLDQTLSSFANNNNTNNQSEPLADRSKAYSNRPFMESFTTNFGRYTYYQQTFNGNDRAPSSHGTIQTTINGGGQQSPSNYGSSCDHRQLQGKSSKVRSNSMTKPSLQGLNTPSSTKAGDNQQAYIFYQGVSLVPGAAAAGGAAHNSNKAQQVYSTIGSDENVSRSRNQKSSSSRQKYPKKTYIY